MKMQNIYSYRLLLVPLWQNISIILQNVWSILMKKSSGHSNMPNFWKIENEDSKLIFAKKSLIACKSTRFYSLKRKEVDL